MVEGAFHLAKGTLAKIRNNNKKKIACQLVNFLFLIFQKHFSKCFIDLWEVTIWK